MTTYYAFNGDADGLCALQQLRLSEGHQGCLITGVKRDVALVARVAARAGDELTVLDVSLDANRAALLALLAAGVKVRYFDHHYAGSLPDHPALDAHIDTGRQICTSLLVDRYLNGAHHAWALVAAYGDGLKALADQLAGAAGLTASQRAALEQLGIALNYNAYGESLADLHCDPAQLAASLAPYAEPLDFVQQSSLFADLWQGYQADLDQARHLAPTRQAPGVSILELPDAPWARRVIGVLANDMMQAQPQHAIALLTPTSDGNYSVSVRVPARCTLGADEFCRGFVGGGGRRGAAGINGLPPAQRDQFMTRFVHAFESTGT